MRKPIFAMADIVPFDPRSDPTCNVLLVAPRFSGQSFWNFRAACEVYGARFPAPPLGLITVAALLPSSWQCRLVNRNTGKRSGHVERRPLKQGRHELAANVKCEGQRNNEKQKDEQQCGLAKAQAHSQDRQINGLSDPRKWILRFRC